MGSLSRAAPAHAAAPPEASAANAVKDPGKPAFEVAAGFDCEGNDLEQFKCDTGLSNDACVAAMHAGCLRRPNCVGFNFPGGWMKEKCPVLMRLEDTTLYIRREILAQRIAEMPSAEDSAVMRFEKISVLGSAAPPEMFAPCAMRVVPTKINLARGGEVIDAVYGRPEEDEYPRYTHGAFVAGCRLTDHSRRATKKAAAFAGINSAIDVVGSAEVVPKGGPCTSALGTDIPGVFMQRYEYANLYHTMLDWAVLYETMQAHNLKRDAFQIVWLDGHAAGALDEPWKLMFSKHVTYVKHIPDEPCYSPAYFPADGLQSMHSSSSVC